MSERPTQKAVTCPECSTKFQRAIVWWDGREIMADRGCLCDTCESARSHAVTAANERALHLEMWRLRVPDDYHRASEKLLPAALRPVASWRPAEGCRRLGVTGPAGAGKTMSVALLTRDLGLPFQWTNGFAARALYNRAVTAEGEARKEAAKTWLKITNAGLLVLDDVDKGVFTEAWAAALFDLLEQRNSLCLPTIWTANHGPGALAKKIAKCGDPELADAIERRLCGGAKVISIK